MIGRLKKEAVYFTSAFIVVIGAFVVFALVYQTMDAIMGGVLWTGVYILAIMLVLNRINAHLNRTMLGQA